MYRQQLTVAALPVWARDVSLLRAMKGFNQWDVTVELNSICGPHTGNLKPVLLCLVQAVQCSPVNSSACHLLLLPLQESVLQVPIWGVALASSSWTPKALQDLVSSAAAMYQACKDLQPLQPLLADRICALCANVATALQQLAANGDAPGMRSGLGAELRSVTGGLCVKLRDLFMPCSGC